jgi:hypothetical protein
MYSGFDSSKIISVARTTASMPFMIPLCVCLSEGSIQQSNGERAFSKVQRVLDVFSANSSTAQDTSAFEQYNWERN